MGLKWFRARLSISKKGAYKVPTMTGIYRRVSHSESNTLVLRKNEYTLSDISPSIANDSSSAKCTSANDKEQQYNRAKESFVNQSPSSNTDSEYNYIMQNEESTTSIEDSNANEQSSIYGEETSKINEDEDHISNTKNRLYQETELVI